MPVSQSGNEQANDNMNKQPYIYLNKAFADKKMKHRFIYLSVLLLTLVACHTTSEQENTCLDLLQNTYSEGGYTMSKWNDYRWLVLPNFPTDASRQTYCAEFMLYDGDDEDMLHILDNISTDFGNPFAQDITTPDQLYPYDINLFALPNNRDLDSGEHLYWWQTDKYIIRLLEIKSCPEVEMPAIAVISLYDKNMLPQH